MTTTPSPLPPSVPGTATRAGLRVLADLPTEVLSQPGGFRPSIGGSPPARFDLAGRRIGTIQVEAVIGSGGMGDVYRGFDRRRHRPVAIKTLREGRRTTANRARFVQEARLLARFDHPAICQVYDLTSWRNRDVLVLELIDGETLGQAARHMNVDEKLRVAEAVATAITVAHHQHVMHRDLKPDNIMITSHGEVKVLDFGIARSLAPRDAETTVNTPAVESTLRPSHLGELHPSFPTEFPTETYGTAGTLAYMSPEQARGEPLTLATDLFSFGVVLQELFTNRRATPDLPFGAMMAWVSDGKSLPAEGLDRGMAELLRDLRHPAPRERPTAEQCQLRIRHLIGKPGARRRSLRDLTAAGLAAVLGQAAPWATR